MKSNMLFQKLQSIKDVHPSLAKSLDRLVVYVLKEFDAGRKEIVPALAAQALRKSEAEALGLLMLLEEKDLLASAYDIYCLEKGTFLKRVRSKKEIPKAIYCKFCDAEHSDPDDLEIQLVFPLNEEVWRDVRQNALV
jgi:hypothetical protein